MRALLLCLVASSAVAADKLPPHPWTKFKPGAWVTFMAGTTDFSDGTLTYQGLEKGLVKLQGKGILESESGMADQGFLRPPASPKGKKTATEKLDVLGKTYDADVWEWASGNQTVREWYAAGVAHPLKREASWVVDGKPVGTSLELVALDEPLYVGPKRLLTARYRGKRANGQHIEHWFSHEVPGGTVLRVFYDAEGKGAEMRMAVGYGESGKPLASLSGLWWHAWASHPVGAWYRGEQLSNGKASPEEYALLKKDGGYVFVGARGGKPSAHGAPIGMTSAAADPTGKLQSSAYVKVHDVEYPCLLFTWQGRDQDGESLTRNDCMSSISRLPIYSVESASVAGMRYENSWLATGREAKVPAGKGQVWGAWYSRKQKLSNGHTNTAEVLMSAEVPGGLVEQRSDLNIGKGMETSFKLLEFGER